MGGDLVNGALVTFVWFPGLPPDIAVRNLAGFGPQRRFVSPKPAL